MRTAKIVLLIATLVLGIVACGGGKEGPDAQASMVKNKMVRIATDAVNLPFEFGAGTGVQGLDVDIGAEIGKDLGHEVKWVKAPFERLFEILKNGEAELVLSAISISPDRKKEFAFSEPYFDSGNTIARRQDKPEIRDLASLSGRKVGVQNLTTGHKFMETQKTASNVTLVKFQTLDDALGALNRTEVDAVVGDEPILTYSIYKSFQNLVPTGVHLTDEKYGVVVRKGEKELLAKVNETITRLKKSGELDAIKNKWFQNVIEEVRKTRAKLDENEALKDAPKDVTFNFIKTGGAWNMERLDGYQVVLQGAQSFQSTPILTNGPRGSCRIANVAPGDYRMNISIFRLSTDVKIPKTPAKSITFDVSISNTVAITQK